MQTKLSTLKAAAARQDWQGALRIAAKFGELGEHKAAIIRGHEAHGNARFAKQLGRDPAADIEAGIAALCARYHLNRDGTENDTRVYGRKDNCIRAARKALGADAEPGVAFDLVQGEAGWSWAPVKATPVAEDVPAPVPAEAPAAPAVLPAPRSSYAAMAEAARTGVMPVVPDFSAATHKGYRGKLAKVIALVEAGDVAALKAFEIKPQGSTRVMLARYRDLAVRALEARA